MPFINVNNQYQNNQYQNNQYQNNPLSNLNMFQNFNENFVQDPYLIQNFNIASNFGN